MLLLVPVARLGSGVAGESIEALLNSYIFLKSHGVDLSFRLPSRMKQSSQGGGYTLIARGEKKGYF